MSYQPILTSILLIRTISLNFFTSHIKRKSHTNILNKKPLKHIHSYCRSLLLPNPWPIPRNVWWSLLVPPLCSRKTSPASKPLVVPFALVVSSWIPSLMIYSNPKPKKHKFLINTKYVHHILQDHCICCAFVVNDKAMVMWYV